MAYAEVPEPGIYDRFAYYVRFRHVFLGTVKVAGVSECLSHSSLTFMVSDVIAEEV